MFSFDVSSILLNLLKYQSTFACTDLIILKKLYKHSDTERLEWVTFAWTRRTHPRRSPTNSRTGLLSIPGGSRTPSILAASQLLQQRQLLCAASPRDGRGPRYRTGNSPGTHTECVWIPPESTKSESDRVWKSESTYMSVLLTLFTLPLMQRFTRLFFAVRCCSNQPQIQPPTGTLCSETWAPKFSHLFRSCTCWHFSQFYLCETLHLRGTFPHSPSSQEWLTSVTVKKNLNMSSKGLRLFGFFLCRFIASVQKL